MIFDIRKYSGNVRVVSISFDTLAQLYEGDLQCYDPADAESNKPYVGKVGVYVQDSYLHERALASASIQVKFSNGYTLLVTDDDVVPVDEGDTPEEFLPVFRDLDNDNNFRELTQAEKDFADKALLQMIIANAHREPNARYKNKDLVDHAISMAMHRTHYYGLVYRKLPDDAHED